MNLNKEIFTTFEVAKLCNANITSIKNWIEKGKLRAFRTPGGHYRIEKAVLEDFLNRYGMPNPFEDRDAKSALIICNDPATVELVRRAQGRSTNVEGTEDPIEAALLIGDRKPNCVVIDFSIENFDAMNFIKIIRANHNFKRMQIVAYAQESNEAFEDEARKAGISYIVLHSEGLESLNARISEAIV